jgi:hypothetical protein
MAGVAGPMFQRSRFDGARFLAGLATGGAAAGLALAVPVFLLGQLAVGVLPTPVPVVLLVCVAVVLGVADLTDRTLHVWRQVPQRLIHSLSPGLLGLTWGFDLGLLVTTQKATSLLWLTIAGITLLYPASAPAVLVGISLVATIGITGLTLGGVWKRVMEGGMDWSWIRRTRRVTGAAMLLAALGLILTSAVR